MALDPICGMTVDPATALSAERDGQTTYFCCENCRRKFRSEPTAAAPPKADPDAIYTCPMHLEIEQLGPGSCPICGMALEPKTVQAETGDDPELIDMTRRLRVAALFAVPLFALAMLPMIGVPVDRWLGTQTHQWLQLVLSTPVVLWAAWPFFVRGWRSIVTRNPNMFTLIALGVGVSYLYSLVAVLAPDLFPESFRRHGHVEVYFEAAAVIVALVLLGQVLELRARSRTGSAIRALLSQAPATARVVKDGSETEVPLEDVRVNDLLRVRPGEKVPVDGKITEGTSTVDE